MLTPFFRYQPKITISLELINIFAMQITSAYALMPLPLLSNSLTHVQVIKENMRLEVGFVLGLDEGLCDMKDQVSCFVAAGGACASDLRSDVGTAIGDWVMAAGSVGGSDSM